MLFRIGPGSNGYNYLPEFVDWDCELLLQAGATCTTGQVVSRDVTQIPGTQGADNVLLPNAANAGNAYGVYQGPTFTNTTTAAVRYTIVVRRQGIGVVSMNAPVVAVTVGGFCSVNTAALPAVDSAAPGVDGVYLGQCLATGAITAKGATIIAIAGATQLVNVAIAVVL